MTITILKEEEPYSLSVFFGAKRTEKTQYDDWVIGYACRDCRDFKDYDREICDLCGSVDIARAKALHHRIWLWVKYSDGSGDGKKLVDEYRNIQVINQRLNTR